MINEKNCTYLYVGNVTNGYADNADVDIDSMPAGSVVLVKTDQTTVKSEEGAITSSPTTLYQLINKLSDGTIVRSPQFTSGDIAVKGKNAYVQSTEQVSYLGYDGATVNGLGTITLGNSYIVALWLNHTKNMYDHKGEVKHISAYATDTSQATVVDNLFDSFVKNFSPVREKYPSIVCERIGNGTYAAAVTGVTVTKGSKVITKTTHGATPTAGTYIRITSSGAPGTTSSLYKVVSYDANSITIDKAYVGDTSASGQFALATVAPTAFGLKFTGIKQPFDPQVGENIKVNFDVLTDSFGSYGNEYKAVISTKGHGTGEEVAQLEAYAQGNETWYRLSAYPATPYRREAVLTNGYDVITVTFKNQVGFAASGVTVTSPWTAVIAIKNGLSYDTLDTAFGV